MPEVAGGAGEAAAAWWAKRAAIEGVRASHFTYEGVMAHIAAFVADPYGASTQLFCAHAVPPAWSQFGLVAPKPAKKGAGQGVVREAAGGKKQSVQGI